MNWEQTNTKCQTFQVWAKTQGLQWHSLPCHLVDVGVAAEQLWHRLPASSRKLVEACFTSQRAPVSQLVAFLASTHDLGKANPYFQKKDSAQASRLTALGFELAELAEPYKHGQASGAFLKKWLRKRWNWDLLTAESTALAVGGHHGTFFRDCNTTHLSINQNPWQDIGECLADAMSELFVEGIVEVEAPTPAQLNAFLGWVSGFVCVADWLGSHESMITWVGEQVNLAEYRHGATLRAEALLQQLGFDAPKVTHEIAIHQLLPPGAAPNQLQIIAAEVASRASFAIVEAPTGEGKTEAAFALAEPSRSSGSGAYFALPTMATANGLYARVASFLGTGDISKPTTRLLHSQSWLYGANATISADPGDEGENQQVQAQDWFSGAKRGLLAPYGVGTIDQALTAALRTRHGFVRLFALAGKAVVMDEVHAYDVYMSDLIDILLGWLRVLGCRVTLLSATLPRARRQALLRAWGQDESGVDGRYPCLTYIDHEGTSHCAEFSVQQRKPLTIELLELRKGELPTEAGARKVLQLVTETGTNGALILNTVKEAQEAYSLLRANCPDEIELCLFHARFTVSDRNEIERKVLRDYGKGASRAKPRILVATQVVEQSLDLDFDFMVSALAPIDLLIQRAGRLHRHRRDLAGKLLELSQADERPNPTLYVISPVIEEAGIPAISDPVYSKAILLRTYGLIHTGAQILEPADVTQAIESVYSEQGRDQISAEWLDQLKKFELQAGGQEERSHKAANRATIYPVTDPDHLLVENFLDLDENDDRGGSQLAARTRLEDRPSITVVLQKSPDETLHAGHVENLRDAVEASIRFSPPWELWKEFLTLVPNPAWRKKSLLSRARAVTISEEACLLGDYTITYDSRTGLQWTK